MFDRISIRTKLIAIVAAPLAVIVTLAAVGFVQRRADAAATEADVRRLEAIDAALLLQYELQREALYSVDVVVSEGQRSGVELEEQRERTDAAAAGLQVAVERLGNDRSGMSSAQTALRQIEHSDTNLRAQVDNGTLEWHWAHELYRGIEASLVLLGSSLAGNIEDAGLAAGARSVTALGEYSSGQARAGTLLAGAIGSGGFPPAEAGVDVRARFDQVVDQNATQLSIVGAQAGAATRVRLRHQMVGEDLSFFAEQMAQVRATPGEDVELDIAPNRWTRAVEATLTQLRQIATSEADRVLASAADRASAAEAAARLYLAGALLAVLLALGLAISVAASIARPVRQLTAAADRLATEQLPKLVEAMRNPEEDDLERLRTGIDQVEVGGGAELSRLTASVNAIQEVAVDVATEQATLLRKGIGEMFVNLARRNQGLLDRQLSYIDELEAQEEDADRLEHLFALDHMATRMRRNAESLLILAGAEPNRRRGKPVPMTKVTQAAVGEIEHFARVDLLDVEEAQITSQAAADVAHLLSELMENATQFSPPDSQVEVVGHRSAEGYMISISDQGIGMSPQQVEEANELLARPPLLGLTLARSLGFIVVSRLAARHGTSVRLTSSPAGGVTAVVILPATLLVEEVALDQASPVDRPVTVPAPEGSSFLPPLVIGGPDPDRDSTFDLPGSLAEAVPTGHAFAEGLDQVATGADVVPLDRRSGARTGPDEARPTGPVPHLARTDPSAPPGTLPVRTVAGRSNGHGPVPPAAPPLAPLPAAPTARPTPPPAPAAPGAARLFGNGSAPPGPNGRSGDIRPTPPAVPIPGRPSSGPPPPPAPVPVPGPQEQRTREPEPELTAAGLVRRVPRRAGGNRPVPGGEAGRVGATTSSRSPDEVRSMLSRFQSGRQAGQAPPPAGASGPAPFPPVEEKDL